MKLYLFIAEMGIEPTIIGPFKDDEERDIEALKHRIEDGYESDDSIFKLDIDDDGVPHTFSYSGGFFEDQICWDCDSIKKPVMADVDGTNLEEVFECPECHS